MLFFQLFSCSWTRENTSEAKAQGGHEKNKKIFLKQCHSARIYPEVPRSRNTKNNIHQKRVHKV